MRFILLFIALLSTNGCATITGPSVSKQEIREASEELMVRSLEFRIKQLDKVSNIGYRLISNIPQEEIKIADKPQPYIGIFVSPIDKYLKRLYRLTVERGLVLVVVIDGSPAKKAGLVPGDVLVSINNVAVHSVGDFNRCLHNLNVGEPVKLQVLRGNLRRDIILSAGSIPINVPIAMIDVQEVNAAASNNAIYVTYGLMNFVRSDDEIAAVLAHELAHFVRAHVSKSQITSLLSLLIGIPLGIIADEAAPGTGDLVMRTAEVFKAHYSRDLEREADYFSVRFVYYAGYNPCACTSFQERFAIEIPRSMIRNYLSTHPSSPERMLRIKKAIEELSGVTCP